MESDLTSKGLFSEMADSRSGALKHPNYRYFFGGLILPDEIAPQAVR